MAASRREEDGSPNAPTLGDVLDAAPFSLEVTGSDGAVLYASPDIPAGEATRTRVFAVPVDGERFSVRLTTDETDERKTRQELFRKAYFDELTGLPNRAVLESSVEDLMRANDARFALAYIDLDHFGHINDYFGPTAGDELLVRLSRRLGDSLRDTDLLARVGGNAFGLLLSPIEDQASAAAQVDRISRRIKEPFHVEGQEIFTSGSIGIGVFPEHGGTFSALISNAERAMRDVRNQASGQLGFYHQSMARAVKDKNRAEQRLRLAIRDRRICCAYQPKVDLHTGVVRGVESLMRWRDEDGNVQSPGELLGIALELGLMDEIARMVLAETIQSYEKLVDAFGPDCSVSINVAARQAGNAAFMRDFIDCIEATGVADKFIIEVTEEAFLARDTFQRQILPMIREAGARVSIDDFGTGYSSLSALADITADEVKIDRSFITDVDKRERSQNVLRAVEALGHSLGMTIVVEGVETAAELAYLQQATRIQMGQGYFFARPLLLEGITAPARPASARPLAPTRPAMANRR